MSIYQQKISCPKCSSRECQSMSRKNWLVIGYCLIFTSAALGLLFHYLFFLATILGGLVLMVTPLAEKVSLCTKCKHMWKRRY